MAELKVEMKGSVRKPLMFLGSHPPQLRSSPQANPVGPTQNTQNPPTPPEALTAPIGLVHCPPSLDYCNRLLTGLLA